MNKYIVLSCCVLLAHGAVAHTQQEMWAVACYLIDRIRLCPEATDCVDVGDSGSMTVTYPTYRSLFEQVIPVGNPGDDWPVAERQQAFEEFIRSIPALANTNTVKDVESLGSVALNFCDSRGATNVLSLAMSVLESSGTTCVDVAEDIVSERIEPSLAANEFIETAITNRPGTACAEHLAECYASKLRLSASLTDSTIVSNGVRMLLRVRQKDGAARQLDKLLVCVCPEYAASSNRMELAIWALQNLTNNGWWCDNSLRTYFSTITNQLLNARLPLVQLEFP